MPWMRDDIEMWRVILKSEQPLEMTPMVRDAFLSALDTIERLAELLRVANPKYHPFKTNGFPIETCMTCGFPEGVHTPQSG